MKKLLFNPWILGAVLAIYLTVLGPALMSALSTIAVVLNIVLAVLLVRWIYLFFKRAITSSNPNSRNTNPKE